MSLTTLTSGSSYDLPGGPLIEGTFLVFQGTVQDLNKQFVLNFYTARGDVSSELGFVLNTTNIINTITYIADKLNLADEIVD